MDTDIVKITSKKCTCGRTTKVEYAVPDIPDPMFCNCGQEVEVATYHAGEIGQYADSLWKLRMYDIVFYQPIQTRCMLICFKNNHYTYMDQRNNHYDSL
jgi:hypothetical protein